MIDDRQLGLFPGPSGWSLAPEGAAVHRAERTAVVADVHLGYEWARGGRGDVVPAHSLAETLAKLDRLGRRAPIARLVVAGDLVESPGPCARTAKDVRALIDQLNRRDIELTWLRGDHDPRHLDLSDSVEVAGWTISHGNRPLAAERNIVGHHHPALRVGGLSAPCFLVGGTTIVLPAFSPNAAGVLPDRRAWDEELRCVAGLGDELLDFGNTYWIGR